MSPWEVLLWVLAVGISIVVAAIVVFLVVSIIRQIVHPTQKEPRGR